jgi:hypothetical protein
MDLPSTLRQAYEGVQTAASNAMTAHLPTTFNSRQGQPLVGQFVDIQNDLHRGEF